MLLWPACSLSRSSLPLLVRNEDPRRRRVLPPQARAAHVQRVCCGARRGMQPSGRRRAARRRLCLPGGPPSPPLHCAGRDGGALSSQNVPRRPGGCSLGSRDRERRCGGWASCGPGDGGRRPAQMVATQVDRDGRGERSVPNAFALAVTLFPGMLCLEPLSRAPQVCLKPLCLKPLCLKPLCLKPALVSLCVPSRVAPPSS